MALSPMLNSILKQKLSFDGFVISDYDELNRVIDQQLPTDFQKFYALNESLTQVINSGVDMMMIPSRSDYLDYIDNLKMAL